MCVLLYTFLLLPAAPFTPRALTCLRRALGARPYAGVAGYQTCLCWPYPRGYPGASRLHTLRCPGILPV